MRAPTLTAMALAAILVTGCQSANEPKLSSKSLETDEASQIDLTAPPPSLSKEDLAETDLSKTVDGQDSDQDVAQIETDNELVVGSTKRVGFAEKYTPPATGTVFTWKNNWASLPKVISYKVTGVVKVGSAEYVKFTSVKGLKETTHAYYDTKNFNLKGYRNSKNQAVVTYKPVEERYRFPMKPGDKWVTSWKSLDHKKDDVSKGGGIVQVMGFEMLDLPAGTFKVVKIRMPLPDTGVKGMRHHIWFAPELGVTVKEQIGGGSMNWTQILTEVQKPSG